MQQTTKPNFDAASRILRILSNPNLLAEVTRTAYTHQLGFEKYILHTDEFERSLRLHFWPDQMVNFSEDIHSHCSAFTSKILFGQLTSDFFELTQGEDYELYNYKFNSLLGRAEAFFEGLTSARLVKSVKHFRNDIYTMPRHSLHRVAYAQPNTATLSYWDKRDVDAIVLKPIGSSVQDCCTTDALSPEAVSQRLKFILYRLQSNDPK